MAIPQGIMIARAHPGNLPLASVITIRTGLLVVVGAAVVVVVGARPESKKNK